MHYAYDYAYGCAYDYAYGYAYDYAYGYAYGYACGDDSLSSPSTSGARAAAVNTCFHCLRLVLRGTSLPHGYGTRMFLFFCGAWDTI